MKRYLASSCALVCALALTSVAPAASANPASAPAFRVVAHGSVTGTITALSGSSFTIQTAGRRTGVVNALTAAAGHLTGRDYPYVYGGGHAQAGIASIGMKGPGYNGKRIGYDRSGSVAAVLTGAGLWPAGGGVPNDAGIIAQLLREHLITRGGGNPHGGAGWLDDGAPDATGRSYKPYHFFPWVLKGSTTAGHIDSFQLGALPSAAAGLQLGVKVRVTYEQTRSGSLFATALGYPGAITANGTVESVAADGSSLTLQMADGSSLTLMTDGYAQLVENVTTGDTVAVTYIQSGSSTIAVAITITATPAPTTTTGRRMLVRAAPVTRTPTAAPTDLGARAPGAARVTARSPPRPSRRRRVSRGCAGAARSGLRSR